MLLHSLAYFSVRMVDDGILSKFAAVSVMERVMKLQMLLRTKGTHWNSDIVKMLAVNVIFGFLVDM